MPACGALYKVNQYKRKFHSHTRCSIKATVIEARIAKLRCETCDEYPQIPVLWARPHVLYIKILGRKFFTLLDNSVNKTAELCRIRPCVD